MRISCGLSEKLGSRFWVVLAVASWVEWWIDGRVPGHGGVARRAAFPPRLLQDCSGCELVQFARVSWPGDFLILLTSPPAEETREA